MAGTFNPNTEFVLRNREGGWSLEVQMSSLEDAASILSRMGANGPVTAHIETLNPQSGDYVRKGKLEIGAAQPSPWRVPETAAEQDPPEPAVPLPPASDTPLTVGASFRLMIVSLAQICFGLFGLLLVGAVIYQAWFFVTARLDDVGAAVAAQVDRTQTYPAYVAPTSSPYSTPGLSRENGIYIAQRVDAMAMVLEHAKACRLGAFDDLTRDKFLAPVIHRFALNDADIALINQELAVTPAAACTLTAEEKMVAAAAMTRIAAEGIMVEAFGAYGEAMGTQAD